ncbi:DUF1307 domain-containing protein [Gemella sanguinis]
MRKILKLITPLLAMLVLLTACSKEKTKVYINKGDTVETQATVYYKGNTVNKMITVIILSDIGDDINAEVESEKEKLENNNNNYGHTFTVEGKNGKIYITRETDYTKIDFNIFKSKYNIPENSLEEFRKLSTVEKHLADTGYKEKK